MVLTGERNTQAHEQLQRITGLSAEGLENVYWTHRHAYDEGKLTGLEFWRKLVEESGLGLDEAATGELNRWDARMWTTQNDAMVAWQAELKRAGVLTAILSNMGDSVCESVNRELGWLKRFDALVWSYRLRIAKPDPAIYRYVLEKLGTEAGETLFIDDKWENVEAAEALGMKGVVFSDVDALRSELISRGMDAELPLP